MKRNIRILVVLAVLILINLQGAIGQEFKLRGRLYMDAFYGLDNAEVFNDGFNNRSARLGAFGKLGGKWDGMIEIDFADATISAKDVRLRRTLGQNGRLWIGQFKVPQGLNELTSSNDITFVERSSASNTFVDSRRMGIALEHSRENAGVTAMLFGRALGQRSQQKGDMPLGLASRLYLAPKVGSGIVHLGISAAWENFPDTSAVAFRDRPEAHDSKGGDIRLIGTSVNNVASTLKTGLELLYLNGPFSVESEFNRVMVNRYTPDDAVFFGYHIQAGYVFSGARSYNKGVVGGVRPREGGGAWEVALRYSLADLNDGIYTGGEQKNITFGINYYVSSNIRFMLNVIRVETDKLADNPLFAVVRAQYSF